MAAIAPIVINDGKATPAAHTFQPVATNPPTFRENGNAGVPIVGENEILLNLKRGSGSVQKAVVTLRVPVLETQSGSSSEGYTAPPKVAYYLQANIELFLHDRTTGDQRKDLRVLASNLLKDPQVIAMIDRLEHAY